MFVLTLTRLTDACRRGRGRPRPQDTPHRSVSCPHRGHLRVRHPAFRVLPQRVGQCPRDDLAAHPARRHRSRREHGLLLDHDPRGTAPAEAAPGRCGQPRLQRGGQHAARGRCPGHGRQLGDALQLGSVHRRLRPLHARDRDLERLHPPGHARPRAAGHGHGHPARCDPDHRRSSRPGRAHGHGHRTGPPAAQPGLRARARAARCSASWPPPAGWHAGHRPPMPPGRCPASATGPAPCSRHAAGGSPPPRWPAT